MSKAQIKLIIIASGALTGLTLILYLPALIWSPPFGKEGYYVADIPHKFIYGFLSNDRLVFDCTVDDWDLKHEVRIQENVHGTSSTSAYISSGTDRYFSIDYNFECKFKVNYKHTSPDYDLKKTSNPFIIWQIKYLEWSRE